MGVTVLTFPTFHSTSVLGGGGCINIPNVPQYFCMGGGAVLTFPTFHSTSVWEGGAVLTFPTFLSTSVWEGGAVLTFPTFLSTSVLGGGGGCINIPNVPQYFCIGGGGLY